MDFKFDIRILILSVFIHFGAYALLSLYYQQKDRPSDAIEVVIRDDTDTQTFLPSKPRKKEEPIKDDSKNSKFFSEQQQRVEKETVAENLDIFKNKKSTEQKKSDTVEKVVTQGPGPNFMPMPSQNSNSEESLSSINFRVPYLSKGEMTFLNADFSTYASFYNRITPKIVYNWGGNVEEIYEYFPHMREKLRTKLKWTTRVELILDRTGHYKNLIIINSSGSPELDQAVQDALVKGAPYLNPPSGMIEKDGTVHILGEFTVYTQRPRFADPQ